MIKIKELLSSIIAASLLAGCATPFSPTPTATNFPTTNQQKLQAASHWNVIAQDVARHLGTDLKNRQPLYVSQDQNKTAFDRAFCANLISALVAQGFTVQKAPAGALRVDIDTQAIPFSANRPGTVFAGNTTALATGVWALHNASAGAILASAAVASDAFKIVESEFATGPVPRMELMITSSVGDDATYIARHVNTYYVADADSHLYLPAPAPVPPITVFTRTIGVTAQ
jgi:hypothetical protein